MKLIIAMIQPEKRSEVQAVLERLESPAIYMSEVLDLKNQTTEMYRGARHRLPEVKLRVDVLVVNDMLTEEIIGAIVDVATDQQSRGKMNILVMPVEDWIPVRGSEPRFAHVAA